MEEPIELVIESEGGIIDCRLDPVDEDERSYSATILYPSVANGFSKSEIYCVNMAYDQKTDTYLFEAETELHPKIKKLEGQLSDAIRRANRNS